MDGECESGQGLENMQNVREVCTRGARTTVRDGVIAEYGNNVVELRRGNKMSEEQVRKAERWAAQAIDEDNYGGNSETSEEEDWWTGARKL